MSGGGHGLRRILFAALALLYLLHNDLWLWNDGRLVAGLPVGLAYHLFYCLAAAALMAALARWAWPEGLENEQPGVAPDSGDGDPTPAARSGRSSTA